MIAHDGEVCYLGRNLMNGAKPKAPRKKETVEERGLRMMKEALRTIRSVGGSTGRVDEKRNEDE